MRTCRNCGSPNPDDARACSRCGRPLSSSAHPNPAVSANRRRPTAVNRKRCPKCGAVINASAPRCPRCRFSFARRKKGLNWRLICAVAAVLVIGVLIGVLASGKRSDPEKEAQPVAVVAATDAPSPAIATEAPRAVEPAPTAGDAFAALQLSQADDAVTVYDAQGNGKRVSRADGAAYLTGRVLEAIHSSDNPEVDVSFGDDTGWEVEVTCALDDAALSGVLAMSDEDIHRRAKDEIVSPAQSAMKTYSGIPAHIAVNWLSSDTGGLALRLAVPANPVFDELGDDPDHPQLYRNDTENDIADAFDGDLDWSDDLSEEEDWSGDENASSEITEPSPHETTEANNIYVYTIKGLRLEINLNDYSYTAYYYDINGHYLRRTTSYDIEHNNYYFHSDTGDIATGQFISKGHPLDAQYYITVIESDEYYKYVDLYGNDPWFASH